MIFNYISKNKTPNVTYIGLSNKTNKKYTRSSSLYNRKSSSTDTCSDQSTDSMLAISQLRAPRAAAQGQVGYCHGHIGKTVCNDAIA